MLTDLFEQLWTRLTGRWVAYQDAPRQPDRVVELAATRAELDDARAAIRAERHRIEERAPSSARSGSRIAVSEADLARLGVRIIAQS